MHQDSESEEIKRLTEQVESLQRKLDEREKSEAALRARCELLEAAFQNMVEGVALLDRSHKTILENAMAGEILNGPVAAQDPAKWSEHYGPYLPDQETPYPPDQFPVVRALAGTRVVDEEILLRGPATPEGRWLTVSAAPVKDKNGQIVAAVTLFRDVSERKQLEVELEARNMELSASEAEKGDLISRLKSSIKELSTPILEVWEDVLAMPVIGIVDSRRSAEMMDRLLEDVVKTQAQFVIIDLTGVELVDTQTADHFLKLVKAVGLIGAQCVVTGIRPAVAQTLVDLGIGFGSLATLRNLRHGLRYCIRALEAKEGSKKGSVLTDMKMGKGAT